MGLEDTVTLTLDEARLTPGLVLRLMRGLQQPGHLVVIEGVDGRFCEGMDLAMTARPEDLEPFAGLLWTVEHTPRPVIALVDGPALGGGCALAATADLVLATPRATFGLPEVLLGLIPAMAFPKVARRVGVARAKLMALGIAALSAEEALRWGLVDAIVPDLQAAAVRYGRRLARGDADAQGAVKALAAAFEPNEHFADRARARFGSLAASSPTQARLERAARGELPWLPES